MVTCTIAQASTIGKKLFSKEVNQNHCARWVVAHVSKPQASAIISRVIKLTYDFSTSNPMEFDEISSWGREELKKLGYETQFVSKSK